MLLRQERNGRLVELLHIEYISPPKRKVHFAIKGFLIVYNVDKGNCTPRLECVKDTYMIRNWRVVKLQVVLIPFLLLIILLLTFFS